MAYDHRDSPDDRPRWYNDRYSRSHDRGPERDRERDWDHQRDWERERARSGPDDRGFFERAGDQISSWFGDDDTEHHAERDPRGPEGQRRRPPPPPHERERQQERGYRPFAGDYARSERARPSAPREDRDPHYTSMRQRHVEELDRDYEEYRRENQSRFESEFGSWREQRMQKRGLLGHIREHMDVVGNDDEHVGTVDRVARDRIILAKSDPESGGAHHSLSCADIARVEGERVILDCSGGQARERWRDESRSRALFEREDQGEMGPRMLDRSFPGTYRD
ncbi:MAG TPA: DUF2171 domain-containing protein [Sphingomicrobium sp.]|nr:DUF2171 domain-containing protein [Sphingomicrobium sp.]